MHILVSPFKKCCLQSCQICRNLAKYSAIALSLLMYINEGNIQLSGIFRGFLQVLLYHGCPWTAASSFFFFFPSAKDLPFQFFSLSLIPTKLFLEPSCYARLCDVMWFHDEYFRCIARSCGRISQVKSVNIYSRTVCDRLESWE